MKDDIQVYKGLIKERSDLMSQRKETKRNARLDELDVIINVWERKYPELLQLQINY